MIETKSFVSLQPQPTTQEHKHIPIKVITYYNDEMIVNTWCKDCKQELEKKVFKWTE